MQLKIYILRQRLPCLLWLLLLLQRSPVVQTLSRVTALVTRAPLFSSAFFKKALPIFTGAVSWHALSGATTFVTSDDENPVSGAPGDDFEFGFFTGGANFAFSYSVEDLPGTLSFNDDAFGPLITGTLPDAGTYTITITGYRFAGLSGNSTPAYPLNLNVAGLDTTKPVITLVGESTVTLTVGGIYTESGVTATDETDGDLTAAIVIGGDVVDMSTAGTYTVTYNVSDAAGNAATEVTRTIVLEAAPDITKPVITLVGESTVTLTVGGIYTESGVTATDETDGDLAAAIVIGGDAVDTSTVGTYTVTYNVSDAVGNAATEVTRTIVVEAAPDITKPVITLVGESTVTLTVGGIYTESGVTATDETDGDLTAAIVIGGDVVDMSTAGTYTVTYNVSDAVGNAATEVTRTVVVQAHSIFQDAEDVGDSWLLVDWLGYLTNDSSHNGWSYHRQLGWIYIASGSTNSGAWIYLDGSSIRGWLWTSESMVNQPNGLPEGFLYLVPDDGSSEGWCYLKVDSDTESSTLGSAFLYDFVANSWNQP